MYRKKFILSKHNNSLMNLKMNVFSAWHIWATITLCERKKNNEREKINECLLRK